MQTFGANTSAAFSSRIVPEARSLLWIAAKDRATGASTTIGFWNGDDHQDFIIGGVTRSYYGAGTIPGLDAITKTTGLIVQMHRIKLAIGAPEVLLAVRGYDLRQAPIELHRALYDDDLNLIDEPHEVLTGWIDGAPETRAIVGGTTQVSLTLASASRALTKTLPTMRSDQALRLRNAADAGRKYASIAGTIKAYWGSKGP